MSASREVVADVSGVPVSECDCRHCERSKKQSGDLFWCMAWLLEVTADAVCSFFMPRGR